MKLKKRPMKLAAKPKPKQPTEKLGKAQKMKLKEDNLASVSDFLFLNF